MRPVVSDLDVLAAAGTVPSRGGAGQEVGPWSRS
jgi:hypothetical protein